MSQQVNWLFTSGDPIGKYSVIERVGAGGFGQVYKVEWDTEKGMRTAALKLLVEVKKDYYDGKTWVLPSSDYSSLTQEISNWSSLCPHPNILEFIGCDVRCATEYGDYPIILSRFVQGGTFHDWLVKYRTTELKVGLNIICGILKGLEHAHDKNIIHCDIKPGNVMLDIETPLIADFGLARNLDLSQSGLVSGTLSYLSPEAIREREMGNDIKREPSLDLWAVGVMVHQLLTERTLHNLQIALKDEPHAFLRNFLNKTLDHDPGKRFSSAREMREDLEYYLDYYKNHDFNLGSAHSTFFRQFMDIVRADPRVENNSTEHVHTSKVPKDSTSVFQNTPVGLPKRKVEISIILLTNNLLLFQTDSSLPSNRFFPFSQEIVFRGHTHDSFWWISRETEKGVFRLSLGFYTFVYEFYAKRRAPLFGITLYFENSIPKVSVQVSLDKLQKYIYNNYLHGYENTFKGQFQNFFHDNIDNLKTEFTMSSVPFAEDKTKPGKIGFSLFKNNENILDRVNDILSGTKLPEYGNLFLSSSASIEGSVKHENKLEIIPEYRF